MAIRFRTISEKKLAALQQEQTGNNCAVFSACAALNLLFEEQLDPLVWSEKVDSLPFPAILKFRMMRNGPVTPWQHVHLIEWIASEHHLMDVSVERGSGTREELLVGLRRVHQLMLVTIGWFFQPPPEIMYGKSSANQNASHARAGYHTLILAAYDPLHISKDGVQRPWGFINSWKSSATSLYWMKDSDFMRSWNILTPLGGKRSIVTIARR